MINYDELAGLMPFGKYSFENLSEYMYLEKRIITEEDLYDLVNGDRSFREIFESDDPLTFVAGKITGKYHIKPQDILNALQKLKYKTCDDFMEWFFAINESDEGQEYLTPNDFKEKFIGDYFFNDDNHLVVSIVNYIDNEIDSSNFPDALDDVITCIIELLNNRTVDLNHKNYSDFTSTFVLDNLMYFMGVDDIVNDNLVDYFKRNVELLASKNNYAAYRMLAYLNYEGSHPYPRDTSLALKYFLKAYEMKQHSDVARTIGYIYYYGYHNDHRTPDYDKAFKYFSSSHNSDGNMEATYKLADCYLYGRGTEKNENAAVSLVSSLFKPCMQQFKAGVFDCKLADVCLRLASYYHNGVFPKKDDEHAQHLASIARCAIKKRIETTSYIGDKSVAVSIENLIKDINKDIKGRKVDNGGYVITKDDELVKSLGKHKSYSIYADIDGVHVEIPKNNVDYFYNIAYSNELDFVEVTHKIHILFKGMYDMSLLDSIEEDDEFFIDIVDNTLILSKPIDELKFEMDIENIVYFPATIKSLDKKYTTVDVEFETNGKLYEYLCDNSDVKVGDSLTINGYKQKRVVVQNVRHVYEDQLPFPLNKMSKAVK